ncbi:hypothetical protein THAPSDRAFT_262540, partial [Thalassiosira pseudonana CCMP1335]
IPIILLAGFLGSGKTSTLKHLLENNQNIKIGTIVNDVASVNIDAKLIANSDSRNDDNSINAFAEGVVELQNGCACCSLADELFASVERLTEGGKRELDAIVVELSGVADPVAVRDNWEQAKIAGHPATKLADLKRTVTLIDSCTFGTDWMTWDTAGDRDRWTEEGDDCAAVRKVPELLAEQVEAADLLLVNKIDLAGEKQTKVASGVARGLNKDATVVEVEFGRVAVKELLGKGTVTLMSTLSTKEWQLLQLEQSTAADQLGITSFVYKSSTPFNSQRLLALLNRWPDDNNSEHRAFVGVLRSKGFCWMAPTKWTGHDTAMYWSHAGKHFGITSAGKWWGTLSKEQMKPYFANNIKEYERIMKEDWVSEEWGDRRQELVFIGTNLDETDIRTALDECLCTDDEMAI